MITYRRPVAGLSQLALSRFVAAARRLIRLSGTVDVLVTSNREMRSLNQRFRKKDKPTDVLSFPAPSAVKDHAGDIAISAEIAAANAQILGHSAAEEIKILALHGLLHLRGYDHESDSGQMARKEARLRQKFHLPTALIERSLPRNIVARRRK